MYEPGNVTFIQEVVKLEGDRAAHRWLCDGFQFNTYYANQHYYPDEDRPPLIVSLADNVLTQQRANEWNALSRGVQQAIRQAVREKAQLLHLVTG